MEESTPKKVHPRKLICRLCCDAFESRHLTRVFGRASKKEGSKEDLASKIRNVCGIDITESDSLSTLICRKCDGFVSRASDFRQRCMQMQIQLEQQCSVKHCVELSPSCKPPSKRSTSELRRFAESSSKQLNFGEAPAQAIQPEPMREANQSFLPVASVLRDETPSLPDASKLIDGDTEEFIRVANTQPAVIADVIKQRCPSVIAALKLAIKESVKDEIAAAFQTLCRRSNGSVLYSNRNSFETLKEFDFDRVWTEMKTNVPFFIEIMNAVSGKNLGMENTDLDVRVKFCFLYSVLMNERWHELSLLKRVNTILIIEGGCTKKLQERLNRLGVCLSHSRRDVLLTLLGGHFADKVVERVKSGSIFRGTGDNWDLKVLKGHMRKDIQNEDLHLFASNLIENRVNFAHLPNDHPKADIVCLPRHKFSLNVGEWKMYADSAKVLVGRIICEFLPKFKWIKSVLPAHIPHRYSKEMAKKSTIVSLPIIDANEAKYEDCVHILRSYEKWIAEIYVKAGLLDAVPEVDNPPVPDGPAAPGQPDAHREDTPGDPMREMKMAFAGDQLTRVRFAGAKDLLSGSHTPLDRFEHCSPFKPVMWHTKASLLQYSYSFLHKAESVNQVGTLKYFREKFNRRNSTPSKVLDSYEGSEELFISVGRAYIISAALAFFGMSTVEDLPSKNSFPANIRQETLENKKKAFDDIFGRFMDEFLFQKNASADVIEEDDFVTNYGLCFIFLTILLLQMKDTAAEADGERNLINQKLLLSVFKSMGTYSKYAIEMFISIAQIECMLTPRLAEEFKWGFFVNWRGGDGKNIEDDLAQEIQNRLSKSIVQRMGSNKTLQSISKVCKATNGITEVEEQFDRSVGLHKSSVQHTTRDSLKDELEMINDLMALNPFNKVPERCHDSFPDIKRCPLRYLNIVEFHQWLDKHKQELSNRT